MTIEPALLNGVSVSSPAELLSLLHAGVPPPALLPPPSAEQFQTLLHSIDQALRKALQKLLKDRPHLKTKAAAINQARVECFANVKSRIVAENLDEDDISNIVSEWVLQYSLE